jgi:hypothetical protein
MLREGMLAAALKETTAVSISTEAALATEVATPASAAEVLILA